MHKVEFFMKDGQTVTVMFYGYDTEILKYHLHMNASIESEGITIDLTKVDYMSIMELEKRGEL